MTDREIRMQLTGTPEAVDRWCEALPGLMEVTEPPGTGGKRLRGGLVRRWARGRLLDTVTPPAAVTGRSRVTIRLIGDRVESRRWVSALAEVANLYATSDQKDWRDGLTVTTVTAELRARKPVGPATR